MKARFYILRYRLRLALRMFRLIMQKGAEAYLPLPGNILYVAPRSQVATLMDSKTWAQERVNLLAGDSLHADVAESRRFVLEIANARSGD